MLKAIRLFITLVTVCLLVVPGTAFGRQDQPAKSILFDLPATVLTATDFAAVGIDGMGRFGNGAFRTLDDYAQRRSEFLAKPLEDVTQALSESGYLQGFTSNLGIPAQPGVEQSPPIQVGFTSVYQYANEEGAEAALAFNTDYSGVTIATVDSGIQHSSILGDESLLVRTTAVALEEEGPSDEVAIWIRLGDMIAVMGIIDYGMTAESLTPPAPVDAAKVAQVEQLAAVLLERMTAARAGETPNLPAHLLRLGDAIQMPAFSLEGYRLLSGVSDPYYNGFDDGFPSEDEATATAIYELEQGLGTGSVDPADPYYLVRLFQFADDAKASAYMDAVGSRNDGGATPTAAFDVGDEAFLLPYDFPVAPGVTAQGQRVVMRVGSMVAELNMESAMHRPKQVVVLELARAQANCLEDIDCAAVAIPSSW